MYHTWPFKDTMRLSKWIKQMPPSLRSKITASIGPSSLICSQHFKPVSYDWYQSSAGFKRRLKTDAVPDFATAETVSGLM